MSNYKLTIQYDGSRFNGWQIQANAPSIQGEIKKAIELLVKHEVVLTGAGRTDTGVNALGQVANFHSNTEIDPYRFLYSLNSILSNAIKIKKIETVTDSFNSRFDAVSRSYLYFISDSPNPFNHQFVYNYHTKFDVEHLDELSSPLIGRHDFSSFTKYAKEIDNYSCKISAVKWKKLKGYTVLLIESDRFLHGMVRAIVGTLLRLEKENANPKDVIDIIQSKNRERAYASAPSKGLFLYRVKYPQETAHP
jgi:tRNA pseudouridine38-40 synthase